ncbi:MAG: pantothenate kinase [Coxiellaceae bacterium]|nr:pantothenate kinase [Coxiellaceae bacterium]|tara:strand:- start:3362 stop:4138 length:777 start_codon:yes stop_codon:yes gene_type:complete
MDLCLDVGNSHVVAGVYLFGELQATFRYPTIQTLVTSDQLGLFLLQALRERDLDPKAVKRIGLCSVVPSLDYSILSACQKYFNQSVFVVKAGVKTGLNIRVKHPQEVGADRIASAVGALQRLPNKNLIVIDLGTATTFCAISKEKDYYAGPITAGLRLSMSALQQHAALLPAANIVPCSSVMGTNTEENIQSGLFFGHLEMISGIVSRVHNEVFLNESVTIVGTGGFVGLFEQEKIFDETMQDLVLQGIVALLDKNSL